MRRFHCSHARATRARRNQRATFASGPAFRGKRARAGVLQHPFCADRAACRRVATGSSKAVANVSEVTGRQDPGQIADPPDEPDSERLGRNVTDLLNELRVAGTGIQVMFAFLLVLPFNAGWKKASTFDRWDYFVTLLCIAIAAVLLIAPSVYHRILFRQREREYLVRVGTRLAIAASVFLAIGLTGILVLISNYVFGTVAAVTVGIVAAIVVASVWFAVPLIRRRDAVGA